MEKVSLPTKTKIAAYWVNLMGGITMAVSIVFLGFLFYFRTKGKIIPWTYFLGLFLGFLIGYLAFWAGLQLLRKKKLGWWVSIILLSISYLGGIIQSKLAGKGLFSFDDLLLIIPIIFLLIDRKNFLKVAT